MTTCVCGAQVAPDYQFCLDCGREVNRPKDLDFSSSSLPWIDMSTTASADAPMPSLNTTDAAMSPETETLSRTAPPTSPLARPARVVTPPPVRQAPSAGTSTSAESSDRGTMRENPQWSSVPRGQLAGASPNAAANAGAWASSGSVPPPNPYAGSNGDYSVASPGTIVNGRPVGGRSSSIIGRLGIGLVAIVALLGKFGGALLGLGLFKWLLFIWALGHGFGGLILLILVVAIVGGFIVHGLGG